MSDRDFAIGNRNFKLGKIDAFKQFHIVRRIAPLLAELIPAMKELSKNKSETLSEDEKLNQMAALAAPLMNGFSKLTDEDSNKVLLGLLSVVEMQQSSGNWARVATEAGIMFQDLELPVLLQAAGRSLMFNMAGFFAVLPQVSHGGK